MQEIELKPTVEQLTTKRRRSSDARGSLSLEQAKTRKISRDTLINRVNYLHFQNIPCVVILEHQQHGRKLRLQAQPEPCLDEFLICAWLSPPSEAVLRGEYRPCSLELPYGLHVLQVEFDQPALTKSGLECRLPEVCYELAARRVKRHACTEISAELISSGSIFEGTLADFSAEALRLELEAKPPQSFSWIQPDNSMTVILKKARRTILTIEGRLLRRQGDRQHLTVVLAPEKVAQRRFPARAHRCLRQELKPAPIAAFTHPLTGQHLQLDVLNLSSTGVAVLEDPLEAQLLPGMTLHDLELQLTDSLKLRCQTQVIHRRVPGDDDRRDQVECGLAILDMDISDHTRLMSHLHRAENRNKRVCPEVDIDRLWEFFFTSGFIYPKKYQSLHEYRDAFRETYTKLYNQSPEIARHIVYQEKSHIAGHMSMLRLCSNSWMLHHHASDRNRSRKAGLDTLELISEVAYASKALYSSHMDYVMCFFRPENRFPKRVFGGVAKHYDDPTCCSVDQFAYLHYRKEYDHKWKDDGPWVLAPANNDDLRDLEAYYEQVSGGLMLKGLDLTAQRPDQDELNASYRKAGLHREQILFALKREGSLVALFNVMRTELGINLSNLSNAITVLVINEEALPREAFYTAISMLSAKYPEQEVPVMLYPEGYAKLHAIEVEKQYVLWVLDCHQNLDPYFEYCNTFFKRLNRSKDVISHDT